jgi:hypothetical protein
MECYPWFRIYQALLICLTTAPPKTAPARATLQPPTPFSYPLVISFIERSFGAPKVRGMTLKKLLSADGSHWNPNVQSDEIIVNVIPGQSLLDAIRFLIETVHHFD